MRVETRGIRAYAYTGTRALVPARRTVVFIHGAANDHSVWVLQSRYFAHHGFNVLAVDLPGHGRSACSALHSITDLSAWLVDFLGAAQVSKATLVGHSMGSLVALETAAQHPDRVEKIAMVGSAVPMPVSATLLETSHANDHTAYEIINVFSHSATAQFGGNRVPGAWMMGASMRLMERSAPGALHADFTACNSYSTGLEQAAKVSCPVLLVVGSKDQMTPARAAGALASKLAHCTTRTLEGAGHALMSERPDALLDALIEFV